MNKKPIQYILVVILFIIGFFIEYSIYAFYVSFNKLQKQSAQVQQEIKKREEELLQAQDEEQKSYQDLQDALKEVDENEHSDSAIYRYGVWHEPETAGYEYELGFDYWQKSKDYKNAAIHYQKALDIDPNYAPALSSLGYIKGAFYNDFDTAKEMLTKAMEIDPTWAYSSFNLGILYDLNGDWPNAKKWMEYTLEKFSDYADYPHFASMYEQMKIHHGDK